LKDFVHQTQTDGCLQNVIGYFRGTVLTSIDIAKTNRQNLT